MLRSKTECKHAFTLVELLVVIVIIALLLAVGMPAWQSARLSADCGAGLSQLRQIGTGIKAYATDHNGRLPGPLWPGQMPMLDPARDGRLCRDLASYLGLEIPAAPTLQPLFIPPAYKRQMGRAFLAESRTYVMNMAVSTGDGIVNPFGSLAGGSTEALLDSVPPASAWAMSDADQLHPRVVAASWKANTPPTLIYRNRRTALYFDGHADDVSENDLRTP